MTRQSCSRPLLEAEGRFVIVFGCFTMYDIYTTLSKEFRFLCDFVSEIRSTCILLRQVMTDRWCRLSWLNQGTETATALLTLIAEFADLPWLIGTEFESSLQSALSNMEAFGF